MTMMGARTAHSPLRLPHSSVARKLAEAYAALAPVQSHLCAAAPEARRAAAAPSCAARPPTRPRQRLPPHPGCRPRSHAPGRLPQQRQLQYDMLLMMVPQCRVSPSPVHLVPAKSYSWTLDPSYYK